MPYIYGRRGWKGATRECCIAKHGMVAAKHPLIGKTGIDIMRKGGNAIDAAVASAFVDCVVEPAMNGIGGEGVMTIHTADGENTVVDYVGRPSNNCTPEMYELLDDIVGSFQWRGVKDDAYKTGYKAITVPGEVAGLVTALDLYGTMELKEVMAPAIQIAEEGFIVGWWMAASIFQGMPRLWHLPEWRRVFLHEGKLPYRPYKWPTYAPRERFMNRDLARSLRIIAKEGPDAFYKGEIAEAIVKEMAENGGLLTMEDFDRYEPIVHNPISGRYGGYEVIYDPAHAGTTLMEILNILEGFDLSGYGFGSFEHIHIMAEAIGLAYADRFKYMGDPGVVDVPQRGLVSKEYAKQLQKRIGFEEALKLVPGNPWSFENCTTAFTVVDENRNAVAVNQTLVDAFGSGVVVAGTGIVMNNAMYGLNPEPGHVNSIDGRKRRIQNVCPTILLKDGAPFMAIGSVGGRAIQTSIVQIIAHVVNFGMDIQSAIEAPRISRGVGVTQVDSRFSREVCDRLEEIGHQIAHIDKEIGHWARPVGIMIDHETGCLSGGVEWHVLGFESEAIGY